MHYNEILHFRRGKMYGLLTVYAIFVDGFEMQALNHVCILHLIWSWVRPQGPYHHPHVKKYHVSPPPPFLYAGTCIFFAYFITPEKGKSNALHTKAPDISFSHTQ